MQLDLADIVFGLTWPLCFALTMRVVTGRRGASEFWAFWFNGGIGDIVGSLIGRDVIQFTIAVALTIAGAVMWWLSRRKRKRAAGLIGAKSAALLAAVVARMRETLRPRPVLRPVPGGARA